MLVAVSRSSSRLLSARRPLQPSLLRSQPFSSSAAGSASGGPSKPGEADDAMHAHKASLLLPRADQFPLWPKNINEHERQIATRTGGGASQALYDRQLWFQAKVTGQQQQQPRERSEGHAHAAATVQHGQDMRHAHGSELGSKEATQDAARFKTTDSPQPRQRQSHVSADGQARTATSHHAQSTHGGQSHTIPSSGTAESVSVAENQARPLFILHDGPPYSNGQLHLGHAMNKVENASELIVANLLQCVFDRGSIGFVFLWGGG